MPGFAAIGFAASLLAAAVPAALAAETVPDFAAGGSVTVREVADGQSLIIEDGRTLRLAGIEAPDARRDKSLAERARATLAKLVANQTLELRFAGNPADRHGSVVAELLAGGEWVQRALVRDGLARVHGQADNRLGLTALLAVEAEARQEKRGIWARPFYAVRKPEEAGRDSGSFQLVDGIVADTASVEGGLYLNFGPDWHTAFSVHIGSAALKLCRAAGLDARELKGAHLRVRGFVDGRRRPVIEITHPEQIEKL